MTRYKQTEFTEDDSSSIGGIQLNEATGHTGMQIRYHTARVCKKPVGVTPCIRAMQFSRIAT